MNRELRKELMGRRDRTGGGKVESGWTPRRLGAPTARIPAIDADLHLVDPRGVVAVVVDVHVVEAQTEHVVAPLGRDKDGEEADA